MIWIYVIILVLLLNGCCFIKEGYNSNYISKDQCNAIKGFFIAVVFARHIWPYLWKSGYEFTNFGDSLFRTIDCNIGQLLVVMFLFYSGYGVMESIQNQGDDYVRNMPTKRFLPTIVNFDVAVLLFLILDLALGIHYSITETLLAFTGWTSIGNSNWYIFVILACYVITYICGKALKTKIYLSVGVIICTSILWALLVLTKESHWHTTLFSYDAGVCFSLYKREFVTWIKRRYFATLSLVIVVILVFFNIPFTFAGIISNALGVSLAFLIVILSLKVSVNSQPLQWLGKNLFPLYIYQRIPMILFSTVYGGYIIDNHPSLYILLCVIVTLICAYAYRFIEIRFK